MRVYLRPPKWPPPLLPLLFAVPLRDPAVRLMLPVVRVGRLFVLIVGREVLRFGVNVAFGLRCVVVVDGRFTMLRLKPFRFVTFGRAVLRVLLSRLLRKLLRLPLKFVEGRLLLFLSVCGFRFVVPAAFILRFPEKFPRPADGLSCPPRSFLWKSPRSNRSLSPCPFDAAPWWKVRPLYQLWPPLWCQLWPPR